MSDNDNQSTRNAGRASSKSKKSGNIDSNNAEIKPKKDADEVLGAIESVEKQLDALRGAHEEHRKLTADLATRRVKIDEFADQVESRETELSTREVELAEMRQELEDREADIVQRASGLEQRESQIAQHADSIEELEAVVETKSAQIDERVEELDKQLEGISSRKDELVKLEEQARERIELDSKLETEIAELAKDLDQTKASLGGREIELKERAKVIEDLAIQAGLLEKQMGVLSAKSRTDEHDSLKIVEEMQTQLDESANKINAHDDAMKRALDRIDELETVAKSKAKDLQSATETISTLGSVEEAHAKSKNELSTLESKLKETMSELKSTQKSLNSAPTDKQMGEIEQRLEKACDELDQAKSNAANLQKQVESVGASATEELESSKAQISKLDKDLKQTQFELKEAVAGRQQIQSDLQSKLDQSVKSGKQLKDTSGTNQSQIQQLQSDLAERDEQITKIQSEQSVLSQQLITEKTAAEEAQSKVNRLGELLGASTDREQELTQKITELNGLLECEQTQAAGRSDEWSASRKERLLRVKGILRLQSDKIRRATEALRDRYDQCEKVLLKRAELVEAYQAVADGQAKLAKREARSGTLLGLSGLGLLLMMIAGMSWFVAGQVVPGAYASRVTLIAKAGERNLTTEDIASWQGYIEQLVTDPQFVEQAASRMKQRGITALAIPGTLGVHMSESLDLVSAEPGIIELEYRGDGAASTQRILDTYALTITAQANAARARRIDGALTSISDPSTVGDSPLDSARIETAGMIFGSTSLATFVFGGIFWRRLAKVKANFERDTRVAPLFDEDSWEVEGKDA